MSKVQEKAQGFTKQLVGEMIGDELLVEEGKQQERMAEQDTDPQASAHAGKPNPSKRRES